MQGRNVIQTIAASLSFLALPGTALAQNYAYTNAPVDVFAGPAPDYPVVAQLPPGVTVSVVGCVSDYSWCDIEVPDLRGWVYAAYLSDTYEGAAVPLMSYGVVIGVPVVAFSIGQYWEHHYHDKPWYHDRDRWANHPPGWGERPPGPPPGQVVGRPVGPHRPPGEALGPEPAPGQPAFRAPGQVVGQPPTGAPPMHGTPPTQQPGYTREPAAPMGQPVARPPGQFVGQPPPGAPPMHGAAPMQQPGYAPGAPPGHPAGPPPQVARPVAPPTHGGGETRGNTGDSNRQSNH